MKDDGHNPKYKPMGSMRDAIVCSCGYQTETFDNAIEKAWDQWLRHAQTSGVPNPLKVRDRARRSI